MSTNALDMSLSFAKHKRRIEETFQQKLDATSKKYEKEIDYLKSKLSALEEASGSTASEFSQLKAENETLKSKLLSETNKSTCNDVFDLLEIVRQRNALDREKRQIKQSAPTPKEPISAITDDEKRPRNKRYVSQYTLHKLQQQTSMQQELTQLETCIMNKNSEIHALQHKLRTLESQLQNDDFLEADGQPKWKKFQQLYYSTLECDAQGIPVTDSDGNFVPIHVKAMQELDSIKAQMQTLKQSHGKPI